MEEPPEGAYVNELDRRATELAKWMDEEESLAEMLVWLKKRDRALFRWLIKEAQVRNMKVSDLIYAAIKDFLMELRQARGADLEERLRKEVLEPMITQVFQAATAQIAQKYGLKPGSTELKVEEVEE